jgi:prepilin-type N-terminal cleavage/methylation domain-containing protein
MDIKKLSKATKIAASFIAVFGILFYFGYGNPLPFLNPEYTFFDNLWLFIFPLIFIGLITGLHYERIGGFLVSIPVLTGIVLSLVVSGRLPSIQIFFVLLIGVLYLFIYYNKKNMKKEKKAFTLIEMLVVIAIVGILATLAVVALQHARSNARDARRVSDIKQISTALDMFMYENGRYPSEEEFYNDLGKLVSPASGEVFLYQFPSSPTPADGTCSPEENDYVYKTNLDGSDYQVSFCTGNQVSDLEPGLLCMTPGGITTDCSAIYSDPDPLCNPNDPVEYEVDENGYKLVHTCCELQHIGDTDYSPGDKFRLANNIDCSNTVNWTWSGVYTQYFRPIHTDYGTLSSVSNIELDGNNFTISDLNIMSSGPGGSLFGYNVSGGLLVKDLTIDGIDISGSTGHKGVIVSQVYQTTADVQINNVHVSNANISVGGGSIGGLIGYVGDDVSFLSIDSSSFSGDVVGGGNGTGGLVGYLGNVPFDVYRSYVHDSTIIGVNNLGGLFGDCQASPYNSSILESYVTRSTISGSGFSVAGFIGSIYLSSGDTPIYIKNSFVKDSSVISTYDGGVSGFIGYAATGNEFTADNIYFNLSLDIVSSYYFGALARTSEGPIVNNSYFIVNDIQSVDPVDRFCLVSTNNPTFTGDTAYYNDNWCDYTGSGYGVEKSDIELKTASTYSSWSPVSCVNANEDNPWVIKDGSYPCLYFEESCTCD